MQKIKLTTATLTILLSLFLTACGDSQVNKPLTDTSIQDMTSVPGVTYEMGSQQYMGYTKKVTLPSFYISKYNVSYRKYDLYTKASGKSMIQKSDIGIFYRDEVHPADDLTWYQANDYCQYLGKITGLAYDLPTEAQWEYVARNNGNSHWLFPTSNGKQNLGVNFPDEQQFSNQKGNAGGSSIALPVGSIPCTPQGVCGMSGAVAQWTKTKVKDQYIVRGEGAGGSPEYDYVYESNPIDPNTKEAGFRCVINSSKPISELKKIAEQHLK